MKIRIKTYNGELPSYLTVGRVYEVVCQYGNGVVATILDNDMRAIVDINDCFHLNGGSWEIVNE